jgi:ubiquinone/menaquinone biosynthesis C-methylase UbiE
MELNTQKAYNQWAKTYDTVLNKTRDLEGNALREMLGEVDFMYVLEIGCGTGKNTEWLEKKAEKLKAIDLSDEMLALAKLKITSPKVEFMQADITKEWDFAYKYYDLISFSLVLEHIENLKPIFKKVEENLDFGGYVYIGELHPFKQYNGTKARFDTENGTQIVDCFNHNISDFINAGLEANLNLVEIREYFDENSQTEIPRILCLLFQKGDIF